jgi:hypothetical protein
MGATGLPDAHDTAMTAVVDLRTRRARLVRRFFSPSYATLTSYASVSSDTAAAEAPVAVIALAVRPFPVWWRDRPAQRRSHA